MNQNQITTISEHSSGITQAIIDTFCRGLSQDEVMIFSHVCKRTGLDPALKQIYAVKRKDSKLNREVMTIQTGIDGYRLIAERTGRYAPGRDPTFTYDEDKKLLKATSYVMKMTNDGTWHEVAASALYSEYVQTKRDYQSGRETPTTFWIKMPHSQLAKCAEALALRKAFPAELSGIYTAEEMQQSDIEVVDVNTGEATIKQESPKVITRITAPFISVDELAIIRALLAKCDNAYATKVMEWLSTQKVDDLAKMTVTLFAKVKERLEIHLAKESIQDAIVEE